MGLVLLRAVGAAPRQSFDQQVPHVKDSTPTVHDVQRSRGQIFGGVEGLVRNVAVVFVVVKMSDFDVGNQAFHQLGRAVQLDSVHGPEY